MFYFSKESHLKTPGLSLSKNFRESLVSQKFLRLIKYLENVHTIRIDIKTNLFIGRISLFITVHEIIVIPNVQLVVCLYHDRVSALDDHLWIFNTVAVKQTTGSGEELTVRVCNHHGLGVSTASPILFAHFASSVNQFVIGGFKVKQCVEASWIFISRPSTNFTSAQLDPTSGLVILNK